MVHTFYAGRFTATVQAFSIGLISIGVYLAYNRHAYSRGRLEFGFEIPFFSFFGSFRIADDKADQSTTEDAWL